MNGSIKRLVFISGLMLSGMLSVSAESAEAQVTVDGVEYSVRPSSRFTYNLATVENIIADESDRLVIPQFVEYNGEQYKVVYVREGAFEGKKIRHLELPAEMHYVLMDAFKNCGLETVIFPTKGSLGVDSFADNDFKGIFMPGIGSYVVNLPYLELGAVSHPETYVSVFDIDKCYTDEKENKENFITYFNTLWTLLSSKRLVYFDTDIENLKIEYSSPELEGYFMPTGPDYIIGVPLDLENAVPVDEKYEKGRKLFLKLGLESLENVDITLNDEPVNISEDGIIEIDTYRKYWVYDRMKTGKPWAEDIFQGRNNVLKVKLKSGKAEIASVNADTVGDVYSLSGMLLKSAVTGSEINELGKGVYLLVNSTGTKKIVIE